MGGPVWIPKIYNGKNKTFFFFSYEGFRNRNGATNATATVPTPEMYNGDFSNWVNYERRSDPDLRSDHASHQCQRDVHARSFSRKPNSEDACSTRPRVQALKRISDQRRAGS